MKVTYISHMGNDDLVVDAARASFGKTAELYPPEKNQKLIKYLANHGHWTPFAHPQITLLCEVPIFVARQDFKHQIGFTRNEQSRRYVDDGPEFFTPVVWRSRPDGSVKQGSGEGTVKHLINLSTGKVDDVHERYGAFLDTSRELYQDMLSAGVAPEQARMVLPQSMYTSYYVTGSLAAWARAYKLRIDPHSQLEIQELAKQWDSIIQPLFPVSWSALT